MHILYTNFHAGHGGGHTTYLAALIRGLRERHSVTLAASEGSRVYGVGKELGIDVIDIDFPGGLRPAELSTSVRKLAAAMDRRPVDIVHVNGSRDHWITVWTALLRGRNRPAIVATKHNSMAVKRDPANWFRARYFTDHVIAVSASVARQIEDSVYRNCGVTTIRHGIDLDYFAPLAGREQRDVLRRQWGATDLVIGSVAGTTPYKSWTTLVEAMALLTEPERQRLRVVVAGVPPSEAQLAAVATAGVEPQMIFPGMADDVRPMIAAFDIGFVLSTAIEALSYACRETMAMGRPMLVSDHGGLPENVIEGRDGWVTPAGDARAVAEWLRKLLSGAFDLQKMGLAARAHAEAEFSVAKFLGATEDVYERVLRARQ